MRKHRKRSKPHPNSASVTQGQQEDMIPCGPSNPHRAKQDGGIEVEYRDYSERGRPLTAGEHCSTMVRRLYRRGDISAEDYMAAQRYRSDFEAAYEASANTLAAVYVDSSRSGPGELENKLSHGLRYQKAKAYLRKLGLVADAAILQNRPAGIEPTLQGIGAVFLPRGSKSDQQKVGRSWVVFICQELAEFYASSRRNKKTYH